MALTNLYTASIGRLKRIPFFSALVSAGFPSPAEDHIDKSLDLSELLVTNPPATFFLRVTGDSMVNAGIFEKDILVVDRSVYARHGDIVVANVNAEFTVKRFYCRAGVIKLVPENTQYSNITIQETDDFSIFGVVTSVVRQLRCSH